MAVQALLLRGFISPLQFIAAFAMVLTGIFDRALGILATSFIGLPVWTGLLIMISAGLGVVVGAKVNVNVALAVTYRTLNIFCSILCSVILIVYGCKLSVYAQATYEGPDVKSDYFAVVAIIFVMALIAVFLSIMGVFASNERNSTYMQLADPPMASYNDQAAVYIPLNQIPGSNSGQMQRVFQAQAVPTPYQPMPQAVFQGASPVMMAPTYMNQMGTANAPVMLMPVQTMQQTPGTSGNGLMYVQVPSGSTRESTPPQVPQVNIHPSEPQSSEDVQGTM